MNKNEIEKGIAGYAHEQKVILRLLRKKKEFTELDFDKWFRNREWKRPLKFKGICGDSFLLGIGTNGFNEWAEMLDLIQHMIALGIVDAKKEKGTIVYRLARH